MTLGRFAFVALSTTAGLGFGSMAQAEMVLSQVIVDLLPGKPSRDDIEVWNDGPERIYVSAEPFEIHAAGKPEETRQPAGEPDLAGILVAPQRLVLEPGERRTIRVAAVGERSATDRIYRVAIKPVGGPISANESALKVFVGYDALVLVRPDTFSGDVVGERHGQTLALTNAGSTAQELFDGQQCDETGTECRSLPAKRLYAGVRWEQTLPYTTPVSYKVAIGPTVRKRQF
jgi:P pilus assembly chaperone PapD